MSTVRCHCCGAEIDWPPLDFGADAPWRDYVKADADFDEQVHLTRDICVIRDEIFFLRCNVTIPVIGTSDLFAWGVWCSVSAKSFKRMEEIWEIPTRSEEPPFFGWLMTVLPGYSQTTLHAKCSIQFMEPLNVPQVEVAHDHPLGQEQQEGMTVARVEELARLVLGDSPPTCAAHLKRP